MAEYTFDWFGVKFESGVADLTLLKAQPGFVWYGLTGRFWTLTKLKKPKK
jgi:hypothetical protein